MSDIRDAAPEFSRPAAVDGLGAAAIVRQITADEAERAALARRFDLLALDRLSADLRIARGPGEGTICVSGRFAADVAQACVVTLEPVHSHLSEEFSQLYTLAPAAPPEREHVVDAEAEDPPEALGPDGLDLGEAVVQQFALALDPYPRVPGARVSEEAEAALKASRAAAGPFAALKALKGGG